MKYSRSQHDAARRQVLSALGLAGLSVCMPGLTLAAAPTDSRLVFIILRGAMDGLAAVAPYGDNNYQRLRGALALPKPGDTNGALKLDGMFALHPALSNMAQRYQAGELLPIHAVASPYRERSHFDGQDLLENGTRAPHGANDGWLNRALTELPDARKLSNQEVAVAFAQNVPLVLRGAQKVGSWAPSTLPEADDDTLQRLLDLYAHDQYFLTRLQSAIQTDAIAGDDMMGKVRTGRNDTLQTVASAAGKMLKQNNGPRIAVLESGGWDTHANQGAEQGLLATRLQNLDAAVEALRTELGATWRNTVVMVATEFGRTVAINGTRGTDHGTATAAFLVGGAVSGGRVLADWPGLGASDLYQGRDLKPTLDLRAVFKGVLHDHLGINDSALGNKVFAESAAVAPLQGLVRV